MRSDRDLWDRLQWAVQLRDNRPGAPWGLASDWWLDGAHQEPPAGKCWPRFMLYGTRAQARAAVRHLRLMYEPDVFGWPEKPAMLWRVVRVRERIEVFD
jgi:hypothetical protein